MSSPQHKYYDTIFSSTASLYGGATGWVAGIQRGTNITSAINDGWITPVPQAVGGSGRLGNVIAVDSLQYRISITPGSDAYGYLRHIIFSDEEAEGALPALADLIGGGNGGFTATIAGGVFQGYLNPSYFGRFKIISDKTHFLTTVVSMGPTTTPYVVESFHDMKGHRVMWDITNGNVIGDVRKGHIFQFWIYQGITVAAGGIQTASTAAPPGFAMQARIRYTDTDAGGIP